jgi:hypothetical protein
MTKPALGFLSITSDVKSQVSTWSLEIQWLARSKGSPGLGAFHPLATGLWSNFGLLTLRMPSGDVRAFDVPLQGTFDGALLVFVKLRSRFIASTHISGLAQADAPLFHDTAGSEIVSPCSF